MRKIRYRLQEGANALSHSLVLNSKTIHGHGAAATKDDSLGASGKDEAELDVMTSCRSI